MALPLTPETGMFPDTLIEPFVVSQEVADLADHVIADFDEFEPIQTPIRETGLAIAYVFETKPFDPLKEEFKPHTIAKVTKASPLWRVLAGHELVIQFRRAFDNYRTGSSLPRTEAAAAIASVLDWPQLIEIVRQARTRRCLRCRAPFRNEGGNMAAKRYCSVACRETAAAGRDASRRARQAGQTGDGRRSYQEVARLRSGIRIAEERSADLVAAIEAMCRDCEPGGVCRTADCPLRAYSPLPLATHADRVARTRAEVSAASSASRWTPAARARQSAMTVELHRNGRIPSSKANHPANDPERRAAWLAALTAGRAVARVAAK